MTRLSFVIRKHLHLAEIVLFHSLIAFFVFVPLARPPASFLVLPLGPIALAAVLYEFVGGLFAALAGMLAVALLPALDPHPAHRDGAIDRQASDHIISVADLEIDIQAHVVSRSGRPISLTPLEFQLLVALGSRAGQVFALYTQRSRDNSRRACKPSRINHIFGNAFQESRRVRP
jgi:hypothetical protein